MRENPGRLAWIVLLTSFFICVSLVVFVPLGSRWYVLNARVAQNVTLEVQQGPLGVTLAGRGEPVAIYEERDEIPERTIVDTDATAGRLVVHTPLVDRPVIATVQLYDDTAVVLSSARSPRFSASRLPHEVALEVKTGRVRVNVSDDGDRSTVVKVHTSYGVIVLTEGSYEVKVNGTTMEITVRAGRAEVTGNTEEAMSLGPRERAVGDGDRIFGPLSAERDLVLNGDFAASLEEGWTSYYRDIQIEGESGGTVQSTEIEGRPVVAITRIGLGHAETGIRQQLEADIRDFSFLRLHLMLRIEEHNVPVCGSLGSECPVMVRIDYKDSHGVDQQWLQGFYSLLDTGSPGNPSFCVTCSLDNEHIWVPEDTWYTYDSDNLIPLLSQDGTTPAEIKSITVYASGHTYESMVAEVELLAQE